jgi:hypothetical protein
MKFFIREKDTLHKDHGRVLAEMASFEEARRQITELKANNPHALVYISVEYPKCAQAAGSRL